MENVSFYNDESVVLWQINPFPDYPFFALNQSVSNTNTSGQLTIWNDLSPGTLVVFSFICWVLVTQQLPENWVLQTEHLRIELNQLNGK